MSFVFFLGQVVAMMQANALLPEEVAEVMDLPVAQVREVLAYYELHRDLVDLELREEASRITLCGAAQLSIAHLQCGWFSRFA
ncbi:MAG: hypothetical protein JXA33_07370 [Anaerolineae bacterium]|nr:hypothetical protein [Anaerolineae bacterium]